MDLNELRLEIDKIDSELVKLFCARMDVAAQIADYKKEHNMPILVPARERAKLDEVAKMAGPDMESYTRALYSTLFELSRSYQSKCTGEPTPLFTDAIENPPSAHPSGPHDGLPER